ncbi:uncharacterized protein BYT42DRAFT_67605 [Radiomyces spectabilis]|uniref:uncharacterized protein n=1 Tax=Radiomyces spectabilis TaxID=64574 RepID=UPI00221EDD80|nr:uncharacterized protein BYT42DRAFT_67605 [Radiomyces spectabilis]KAI8371421.1 hypothetical protein BYT42DRAFT_67605 [Radiomyces spectabilis]
MIRARVFLSLRYPLDHSKHLTMTNQGSNMPRSYKRRNIAVPRAKQSGQINFALNHPYKPKCTVCNKVFKRNQSLKQHMLVIHPVKEEVAVPLVSEASNSPASTVGEPDAANEEKSSRLKTVTVSAFTPGQTYPLQRKKCTICKSRLFSIVSCLQFYIHNTVLTSAVLSTIHGGLWFLVQQEWIARKARTKDLCLCV